MKVGEHYHSPLHNFYYNNQLTVFSEMRNNFDKKKVDSIIDSNWHLCINDIYPTTKQLLFPRLSK